MKDLRQETLNLIKEIIKKNLITEKEINLLKRRYFNAKILRSDLEIISDNTPLLTKEQFKKGITYLKNKYRTPAGKVRTTSPFGFREIEIIEKATDMTFDGFYYDHHNAFAYPLYSVISQNYAFQYYLRSGKITITN